MPQIPNGPPRRLTPPDKQAARETFERCQDAAADFNVVVAAGTVIAWAAGVFVPYEVTAGVLAAILNRYGRRAQRAAEDPPRDDFESETRAVPPRIHPEIALGDSPLELRARPAANSLRDLTADLSALVRALERADGAWVKGRMDLYERRLAEVRRFASEYVERSHGFMTAAAAFADAWNSELPPLLEDVPLPVRSVTHLDEALRPDVRERLLRAGVTPNDLRVQIAWGPESIAALRTAPEALVRVADETVLFAEGLRIQLPL